MTAKFKEGSLITRHRDGRQDPSLGILFRCEGAGEGKNLWSVYWHDNDHWIALGDSAFSSLVNLELVEVIAI